MSTLVTCNNICKSFSVDHLFNGLDLHISDSERLGIVGPNGAGKSTLLGILAAEVEADSGTVSRKKGLRLGFVAQDDEFDGGLSIFATVLKAASRFPVDEQDWRASVAISSVGFDENEALVSTLSGGWKKRLSLACGIVNEPELLLLDEPTNHLDFAGLVWLEEFLNKADFAWVAISHDRFFLERTARRVLEVNSIYPTGAFCVEGNYSEFVRRRDEYLLSQEKYRATLENKLRRETEWLRRGPKARSTKAKFRIDEAGELKSTLAGVSARLNTTNSEFEFSDSKRRTKRLIAVEGVSKAYGELKVLKDFSLLITPGDIVGILGVNGSGKTTILKLLSKEIAPDSGSVEHVTNLRLVYFDQQRSALDQNITLKSALTDDSDSVVFNDRLIHVVSWAKRFQLSASQMETPVSRLSGGEQARVLLANLMRQPADVLILDEPTNDLDIPALETLEEALMEFTGAVVLVTHDRYLLDRLADYFIGLDGSGTAERFASYQQWEHAIQPNQKSKIAETASRSSDLKPKKLSYKEQKEFGALEGKIETAEIELDKLAQQLADPENATDFDKLISLSKEIEKRRLEIHALYERWGELGNKGV